MLSPIFSLTDLGRRLSSRLSRRSLRSSRASATMSRMPRTTSIKAGSLVLEGDPVLGHRKGKSRYYIWMRL
jgi:hypothetical protein